MRLERESHRDRLSDLAPRRARRLQGLLAAAPVIGDIPSVPTITGLFVLLVAGQLVFHRDHFWLPRWMLRRSVTKDRLCKALEWLRRPARFVDRLLQPRLGALTRPPAVYAMAVVCGLIALSMPAMEVIPFAANVGLLALLGFIFTVLTIAVGAYALL